MNTFRRLIERLTWRRKACPNCKYLYSSIKESSPCALCKNGSEFRKYKLKETDHD